MTRRSWLSLLVLSAVWGASYLFIGWSLAGLTAPVVVFGRLVVGAVVLALVAGPRSFAALSGRWGRLAVFAVVEMVCPYLLIAYGEGRVPSGLASMLVSTQMVWVVVLAPLVGPRRGLPRAGALVGVAVGLVGVVVLADPFGAGRPDPVGVLLVTAAAVSYAVGALLLGRLLPGVPALPVTAAGQGVAALVVVPFAAADLPRAVPPAGSLAALAVLGIACTAGGFALFNAIVARSGAGRASLVSYLAPAFSVTYGVLAGERLTLAAGVGLVLILAGSALTTAKRRCRVAEVNDAFRARNAQMASSTLREPRTGLARFSARLPNYVRHRGVRRDSAGVRHRGGRPAAAGVPGVRLGGDCGRLRRDAPLGEAGGQAGEPVQGARRAPGR